MNITSKVLGTYTNGNYRVKLYDDGTKIRIIDDDAQDFVPVFAENIDIKICDYCDMGCPMCHENSTLNGGFGDILNEKFIETLHPYQEIAIGGGDATAHPDLIPFLEKLKEKNVIANLTVNQIHFNNRRNLIRYLTDNELIHGLGVSFDNSSASNFELLNSYPNTVIHLINGLITPKTIEHLGNKDLKILILGYKCMGRGVDLYELNREYINKWQNWLYENLETVIRSFKCVSFDNLALEQLNVKRLLPKSEWDKFYMGDDGKYTFYIDMVKREFAPNSTTPVDKRYKLLDSVDDMFEIVRNEGSVAV